MRVALSILDTASRIGALGEKSAIRSAADMMYW
jgi:hypothetical protein